jgi:hypothetical protein
LSEVSRPHMKNSTVMIARAPWLVRSPPALPEGMVDA